ncbi:hypothetical protein BUALT_Bualt05G0120100 [Buddleja alternifolia]|uniref:Uncharacterized protein n=1 Tax=Buddleja alternifolia TaxID=168488 RepID=A0AAV6XK21_9LAMI|nr:hypothetical protein BUALT_Bualt05G0120100 [Buddleja alternifolia]
MQDKLLALPKFLSSNGRAFWGWFFLIIGSFSYVGFLYAAVISKLLPPSDNLVIHAIQNDWYVSLPYVLLFLGATDTSNPRRCDIYSLAEHEIVQACVILLQ